MRLKDSTVLEDLDSLSNDLLKLGSEEEGSDLVFMTGREEKEHNCHRSIFSVRCKYFHDVVVNNSEPSGRDGRTLVHLPSVSTASFTTFKQFIYTGRLVVDTAVNVIELIRISEIFGVQSLGFLLQNSVENNLTLSSVSQFFNQCVDCFGEDNTNNEVTKLLFGFLKEHLTVLRDRKLLNGLSKDALIRLIKSNTLDIEENEVWRLCLEWARGQVGLQDSNPSKLWTEEQRSDIRASLDGVVQCIKILHIDSSVFAEEVEPTGAIPIELSLQRYKHAALPDKYQHKPPSNGQFSDNRQEFTGAVPNSRVECARALPHPRTEVRNSKREEPPRTRDDLSRLNPRVESDPRPTLYQPQHHHHQQQRLIKGSNILSSMGPETSLSYYEQLLNGWVGTPNQTWTVIFRASEHAFSAQAFHRMCDGASPSFVLVKADTGVEHLPVLKAYS